MVSRPRLMSIDAPFRESGTQIFQEKWKVVFCTSCAICASTLVTLSSTRWVQVRLHINWTDGCGSFISSKVEQWNSLGCKQTHDLK